MWGQALSLLTLYLLTGIIPTRVGTSDGVRDVLDQREDHPHACGDKSVPAFATVPVLGSSPRVWGQESGQCTCVSTRRIIPTRVGTSIEKRISYFSRQDHPHACGDKTATLSKGGKIQGSSPRVWGQEIYDKLTEMRARIIPTRVGTSVVVYRGCCYDEDHPHACGDKDTIYLNQTFY